MPATQTSPAPSQHHRCTDLVRVLDCTGLDVVISGDRCALHLYSTSGKTTVLLPTERFLKGARGPRDCNGHPFPERRKERHEALREQLEHDAEISRALRAPAMPAIDSQPIAPPPAPAEPRLDDGVTAPNPPPVTEEPTVPRASIAGGLSTLRKLPDTSRPEAREHALRAAWEVYIASPELNFWDIGQRLGATPSALRRVFDRFAEEPGAPMLKPNGKL